MKNNYSLKLLRGLISALLAGYLLSFSTIGVYAETVNDLKAYLGYTVELETIRRDLDTNSDTKTSDESSYQGRVDAIQQLNKKIVTLENTLKQKLEGLNSPTEILIVLNEIIEVKAKYEEQSKLQSLINQLQSSNNEVSENEWVVNSFKTDKDIEKAEYGTPIYDIGVIGNNLESPVNGLFKIVTPFGYRVDKEGSLSAKNNTLELSAPEGRAIKSQWNGVVYSIENGDNDSKNVVISHSNGLFTVYNNLKDLKVGAGKKVNQYDIIGYACGISDINAMKENYIGFEVVIDSEYINPLLLYGNSSKKAYEDWLSTSSEVYVVDKNEYYYYTPNISKNNPNSLDSGSNINNNSAELIEGYSMPNPGVLVK